MITGRLVALAAVGVLLAPLGVAALIGWALVLLFLLLVDVALAAPLTRIEVTRPPPVAVRLGEAAETALRLTNTGGRRWQGQLRDAWVPSAGVSPREQRVAVPPGERRTVTSRLRPTRRGPRLAVQVALRSFGPLGLAARQRRITVPGRLLVLPAFASRRFLPEKLSRLRQIEGAVLVRRRGQGSEFDSLRQYVPGDDVRAIDWRATARSHDVVVRTWRPERDRHIVLAVDTGRTSATRIGDEPRLDAALDAALLLAAVAARAGDRIALVAADVAVRARLALTSGRNWSPR
jgi:uncharacterized protein (DUF58 family)